MSALRVGEEPSQRTAAAANRSFVDAFTLTPVLSRPPILADNYMVRRGAIAMTNSVAEMLGRLS